VVVAPEGLIGLFRRLVRNRTGGEA